MPNPCMFLSCFVVSGRPSAEKEAAAEHPAESAQPIVGEGAIDMRGVFSHMRERKTDWAVLEVESYPCGEAEYLCRSLENMKKLAKD